MKNFISVIIPAYNEEKDIEDCIKSLNKQNLKNFEIIIVDDGSTDNTRQIVRKFKKIKLIFGQHKGPAISRNLGAKQARGIILVFVDADMTFDKNYIRNLVKLILEDKTGKIIGTTHDNETVKGIANWVSNLWGNIRISPKNAHTIPIFRAIRKDKFLELGGFDPKYGYADDQTLLYKYGIKPIVAKNTICYHKNPDSLKSTYKQARWIGASWKERFWFFKMPFLSHLMVLSLFFLLPFMIITKSLIKKIKNPTLFMNLMSFYAFKFAGYAIGAFRAVYLRKVWK